MSTATERIMRERGDLTCFHEPFMYYYYVHLGNRQFPHHDVDPGHPTGFHEIWQMLYDAAESGPVFFKDMAYYVWPEMRNHPVLASSIRHVFLIRDPRRSIPSYHRLDPAVTLEEVGLEAEWRLAEWVNTVTGDHPPVIEAESIQSDPEAAMRALWSRIGLDDRPGALCWSEEAIPDEWRQVADWHRAVSESTGIRPPDEDEAAIEAAFSEAATAAPRLTNLLTHHMPFYRRLQAWALPHGAAGRDGNPRAWP